MAAGIVPFCCLSVVTRGGRLATAQVFSQQLFAAVCERIEMAFALTTGMWRWQSCRTRESPLEAYIFKQSLFLPAFKITGANLRGCCDRINVASEMLVSSAGSC